MITATLAAGDIEASAGALADLWSRAPDATPFQHPAWLGPWCRRFGAERARLLVVKEGSRLMGMLPCAPAGGVLRLAGEGISDYLDVLVDPAHRDRVEAAFAAEIGRWGAVELTGLRASSPLLALRLPDAGGDEVTPDDVCPVLSLDVAIPREMARNLRRARARAEALGEIGVIAAGEGDRAALLEALFALHGARWGGGGVLGDEAVRAFHREVTASLLEAGLLRLRGLTLGDRLIAVVYGMMAKEVSYLYLQGYDPASAELSPGALAVAAAIASARGEGARAVDMLRGREGYKYRFGARDEATYRRSIRARVQMDG